MTTPVMGIQLYTLRDHIQNKQDFDATLARLSDMGVDTVQISGIGDILKANRMGLTWARLLMDDFVSHLSIVLQLVRAMLDPDCIILGGDITEALRVVPGLLPDGDYTFGERFEDACAQGAAAIALQGALHQRIDVAMEATGDLE